jgi:hypothetical protein
VQIYVFSQKGGGFSLKNQVIFQTIDSKAIKIYPMFCKDLVSFKSCVEQLQFPHEKGSSSHSECLVIFQTVIKAYPNVKKI